MMKVCGGGYRIHLMAFSFHLTFLRRLPQIFRHIGGLALILCLGASLAYSTPILSSDFTIYRFGVVRQGKVVSFGFNLANLGDRPIHIMKIETSMRRLTTRLDKTVLRPHEHVHFVLNYDTAFSNGDVSPSATVTSDIPGTPCMVFTLSGRVVSPSSTGAPLSVSNGVQNILVPADRFIALLVGGVSQFLGLR